MYLFKKVHVHFLCPHHWWRYEVLSSGFIYVSLLVHGFNSLSYFFSYLFSLVFLKLTVFLSERCSRPVSMYSCLSCITTVDPLSAFLMIISICSLQATC